LKNTPGFSGAPRHSACRIRGCDGEEGYDGEETEATLAAGGRQA
jgi:hypothetical protein